MLAHQSIQGMLLLSILALSSNATAATSGCETHSGPVRAQLIELYTSEGCSSCPPADKWVSALVPKVFAAGEVVPLSYHVDYWDRLGWRDRFADPAYTARQYAYSKVSGSSFVFTPQIILAGRNFQNWSNTGRFQKDARNGAGVPDANIVLRQKALANGKLGFEVQAQTRQGTNFSDVHVYAALFQNSIISEVLKGENEGNRLQHDYVVRSLYTSPSADQAGKISVKDSFTLPADAKQDSMGVAVFVQDVKTGTVLQAMSAPLCVSDK
jgi:hypothetical protein